MFQGLFDLPEFTGVVVGQFKRQVTVCNLVEHGRDFLNIIHIILKPRYCLVKIYGQGAQFIFRVIRDHFI